MTGNVGLMTGNVGLMKDNKFWEPRLNFGSETMYMSGPWSGPALGLGHLGHGIRLPQHRKDPKYGGGR